MKSTHRILLAATCAAAALLQPTPARAQAPAGKNKIVRVDGRDYLIHTVKRGETLYRISKEYGLPYDTLMKHNPLIIPSSMSVGTAVNIPQYTTKTEEPAKEEAKHEVKAGENIYRIALMYGLRQEELLALNPDARAGIHPGDQLRLPSHAADTVAQIARDDQHLFHIVAKGETLYAISTKYGLKVKQLQKTNPQLRGTSVREGDTLNVPILQTGIVTDLPEALDTLRWAYHQVQPKETLHGISRKYATTIDELKRSNPSLENRDLLAGELLRLPKSEIKPIAAEPTEIEQKTEVVAVDTIQPAPIECTCQGESPRKELKVALMLPLYTSANDPAIFSDNVSDFGQRKTLTVNPDSRQFLDFYQGALLALQDLKRQGIGVDLRVVDTENSAAVVSQFTESPEFAGLDLVIGPVYKKSLEIAAKAAQKHGIPIVSPLSTEGSFLEGNPMAFQVSPTQKLQDQKMSDYIAGLRHDNFVVVFDGNQRDSVFIPQLKREIFSRYTPANVHNLRYVEYAYYKGGETQLMDLFRAGDTTVVIVPSKDKAFISDIVARLNTLSSQQKILLFGQPRWAKFDNIKLEFFHNLNTHLLSLSFLDYDTPLVTDFVRRFRGFFKTEPSARAYEGYDVTRYFVEAVSRYPAATLGCCLKDFDTPLLQMRYRFEPAAQGSGFINRGMFLLHYGQDNRIRPVVEKPQ